MESQDKSQPVSVPQAQAIAAAIAAAPVVYFIVCLLLDQFVLEEPGGFAGMTGVPSGVLLGFGLITACGMALVAPKMRDAVIAQSGKSLEVKIRAVILSMALAETGAVFGVVYFLLTGNFLLSLIPMAIAFVGTLFLFPSRRWLQET